MKNKQKFIPLSLLLILSFNTYAINTQKILETDWLKTEVGSAGENLGAKVESIDNQQTSGVTVLEISLPLKDIESIDSIEVISKITGKPIKQVQPPEWIDDYEKDKQGLRLYINKKTGFEFRLRLIDNVRD